MTAPVLRPLSLGETLDVAFAIYRAHFVALITIAAVCRIIPSSLGIYIELTTKSPFDNWMLLLGNAALTLVLTSLALAATTTLVSGAYLGERISAADAFQGATGILGRLIVVALGSGVMIFAGLLLLIIPGVIAMAGLALASAVVVLEETSGGVQAMQRSWDLTKGYRWKVFGTLAVTVIFLIVPNIVVAVFGFATALIGGGMVVPMVLATVLSIFIYPFIYVVTTVLYYDIRVRKEGFDLELLATTTSSE